MTETIYADAVTDITVIGANARIRFHTLAPNPDGKGKPLPVHAFTVVMPVESVATLGETLPKITDKLMEAGRLKKVSREKPKAD